MEISLGNDVAAEPNSQGEANRYYATVSEAPPKRPAGRTKFHETRHPVFKGVRRRGSAGRWVCEVREPNKKSRIWLGTFPTAEMAARAHDVAAMMLRGNDACLNFADSAWRLRVPASFSSSRDIARAAAQAAEAFRPSVYPGSKDASGAPSAATSDAPATCPSASASTVGEGTPVMADHAIGLPSESCGREALEMMSYDHMDMGYYDFADMHSTSQEFMIQTPAGASGFSWDDADSGADVPLWSYSI